MAIISKEELLFTLKIYGYVKARVANYFDVDEASIRRWCKKYDIDCIAEQWAISLELNDRMHKKYEKEKEKKATQKQNQPNCAETILVIADTHEPFTHPRYRDFCCRVRDKYKADCFVHIGDEVDQHALSYHEHNPDGMSAGAEVEAAKKALQQWYAEFPEMYVCVGNHTALLYRKAKTYGIPTELLRTYNEIWEAPEGWLWYDSWLINGVRFQHGHGKTGMNAHERWAVDNRESTVIGHCFSEDTEILTQRGWVCGLALLKDDIVATMNKHTRKMEWNAVKSLHYYDTYKQLYHIKSQHLDLMVTDGHGMIYENINSGKLEFKTAEECARVGDRMIFYAAIPNVVQQITKGAYVDSIRLIIWIVADGTFDARMIRWHLKKRRKIIRLKALLRRLEIRFTEHKSKNHTTRINIRVPDSLDIIGRWFPQGIKELPFNFGSAREVRDVILEEYSHTDGYKASKNAYQISSFSERTIDILQELFATSGYRCLKTPHGEGWTLAITKKASTTVSKSHFTVVPYEGMVWCASVHNGTLLVRRNGKVCVTQNTHAHAGVKYLASTNSLIFGMNVGCGIDITAYAMEYATTYSKRPVLGCGIVTDNGRQAIFVPMEMS